MKSPPGLALVRRIAAGSAIYALACIAGIYLSESERIPISESWFHGTQFLACGLAGVTSALYLWMGRKREEPRGMRAAMAVILFASAVYLGLIAFVIATFTLESEF